MQPPGGNSSNIFGGGGDAPNRYSPRTTAPPGGTSSNIFGDASSAPHQQHVPTTRAAPPGGSSSIVFGDDGSSHGTTKQHRFNVTTSQPPGGKTSNMFGSDASAEPPRSSTRTHQPPGGASSIFSDQPLPQPKARVGPGASTGVSSLLTDNAAPHAQAAPFSTRTSQPPGGSSNIFNSGPDPANANALRPGRKAVQPAGGESHLFGSGASSDNAAATGSRRPPAQPPGGGSSVNLFGGDGGGAPPQSDFRSGRKLLAEPGGTSHMAQSLMNPHYNPATDQDRIGVGSAHPDMPAAGSRSEASKPSTRGRVNDPSVRIATEQSQQKESTPRSHAAHQAMMTSSVFAQPQPNNSSPRTRGGFGQVYAKTNPFGTDP